MSPIPPSRTGMRGGERQLRSRLVQLLATQPLMRGTLVDRRRRCGKPTCRCATDPAQAHPGLYLFARAGRQGTRQKYVPTPWHARVRQAVANYQELRRLLAELSDLHWAQVQPRRRG